MLIFLIAVLAGVAAFVGLLLVGLLLGRAYEAHRRGVERVRRG